MPRTSRARSIRIEEWWEAIDFSTYPEISSGERLFLAFLKIYAPALPEPMRQRKLWQNRRLAADFYWEDCKLLVEIEGGEFTQGRHTRGVGFQNDCWKYNELAVLDIALLRFTPTMLKKEPERCQAQLMAAYVYRGGDLGKINTHSISAGANRTRGDNSATG